MKMALPPPLNRRLALEMSAAAHRTVFVALILSVLSLVSHPSVLAQDYTWTGRVSAAQEDWKSVTYGNGLFVAVASYAKGNDVMTSPDGITWTIRTAPGSKSWVNLTYGNGLFVAVGDDGDGDDVMTSPDGTTWTLRTTPADKAWRSVTYGNGRFVAVGDDGNGDDVMTSPDGITWTLQQNTPINTSWSSVTYGNGLFVAVASGGEGNYVMTSLDGITWTERTAAANTSWISVTYGNGLFVAVGSDGEGNDVMTSPDGITWTSRTALPVTWSSVIYGNGLFVAIASYGEGDDVLTSPDGATWTLRSGTVNTSWISVTFGNGLFVAICDSNEANQVMTMSWQAQMAINAGNNQTAAAGTAVATAPSVIVRNPLSSPIAGVSVTFAVASGGGSIAGGAVMTNASGIATVGGWTLGSTAGSNTLTATSTGLTGSPLTFTATGTASATVDPPTVGSLPGGETRPGDTVTLRQVLTNPSSTPTTMTYVANLPPGLAGVGCSAPVGTCVIATGVKIAPGGGEIYRKQSVLSPASTATVTWTGTIPANGTVTIIYVVQISGLATNGTQYQISSTINGSSGPSVTITVKGAPVGPGDPIGAVTGPLSAQKPGSVLIYNLYSSGFNPQTSDSRITITNISPSRSAYVRFFFIDGSNCSVADMTITLTQSQTTSFLASDFDPGVTGYLIAVATDSNGCPVVQNDLVGESLVRLESGYRATLPALGVAALGLSGASCNPNETTTTLAFDGLSYNALPRALAVSGLSSIASGYSSLLVVNRIGGNLGTRAERLGSLFGLLYDDQEVSQSFTLTGNVCQLRGGTGQQLPADVAALHDGHSG